MAENISYELPSRIHATLLSHDGSILFATDLGRNRLLAYKVNFSNNKLELDKAFEFTFPDNCKPRHMALNADNDILYVVCEDSCDIYSFVLEKNKFKVLDITSILPNGVKKETNFTGCTMKISKCNKFLYTPVRGHNSISVFEITSSGLNMIQNIPCEGINTRDISFNYTQDFLLSANLGSDNISVFTRDQNNGLISYINSYSIPSPACIIPSI